jgi:hypothetical protein
LRRAGGRGRVDARKHRSGESPKWDKARSGQVRPGAGGSGNMFL